MKLFGSGSNKGDDERNKNHHTIYTKPKRGYLAESGKKKLMRDMLNGSGIDGYSKRKKK